MLYRYSKFDFLNQETVFSERKIGSPDGGSRRGSKRGSRRSPDGGPEGVPNGDPEGVLNGDPEGPEGVQMGSSRESRLGGRGPWMFCTNPFSAQQYLQLLILHSKAKAPSFS